MLDASGKPLLALIVGHRRVRTGGNVPEEVYVRRPDENQSWLAEGSLDVDSDPQLWLDRDIMNIDHSRIAKVVVTHGAETLDFARAKDKFALETPADHPKLDDYKLEDVSRALELLTFEDVHPEGRRDAGGSDRHVGVQHVGRADGARDGAETRGTRINWARFSADGAGKSKAEADKLQAQLAGWTYQIGAWKQGL